MVRMAMRRVVLVVALFVAVQVARPAVVRAMQFMEPAVSGASPAIVRAVWPMVGPAIPASAIQARVAVEATQRRLGGRLVVPEAFPVEVVEVEVPRLTVPTAAMAVSALAARFG